MCKWTKWVTLAELSKSLEKSILRIGCRILCLEYYGKFISAFCYISTAMHPPCACLLSIVICPNNYLSVVLSQVINFNTAHFVSTTGLWTFCILSMGKDYASVKGLYSPLMGFSFIYFIPFPALFYHSKCLSMQNVELSNTFCSWSFFDCSFKLSWIVWYQPRII